jgi:hypothetical protein
VASGRRRPPRAPEHATHGGGDPALGPSYHFLKERLCCVRARIPPLVSGRVRNVLTAVRFTALISWLLAALSVFGNPVFLGSALVEFTALDEITWFAGGTAVICLLLVVLGLQCSYDIAHRSRLALRLAAIQGILGILVSLAGLVTIGLRIDSIVDRGIFSGYPEAWFFMFWALIAACAYGYVMVAVRRNSALYFGNDLELSGGGPATR